MSWSFSMSGHFEGEDAVSQEHALIEELRSVANIFGAVNASFYGSTFNGSLIDLANDEMVGEFQQQVKDSIAESAESEGTD